MRFRCRFCTWPHAIPIAILARSAEAVARAVASVVASIVFAAISGSSPVTLVAVGSVMFPAAAALSWAVLVYLVLSSL